jgi:hypothetical protein
MKTLTTSIVALVLAAAAIAALQPGNTAGVVLALGSPFALFANVMATEAPREAGTGSRGRTALLVDWM